MRAVPREAVVPSSFGRLACQDGALAIGHGQTISQPYIVAAMSAAAELKAGPRVLEIGTGSGYGASVLSRVATEVYTVERAGALAEEARARLAALGDTNVDVCEGDGSLDWPEHAPYGAIVVAADGPHVPKALLHQMAVAG